MKKKLNKTTKSNLITYAMVVIVYIIVQLLVSGGAVSSLMKGLLVPLCVYSILAVSLNLTVGILGELSLGHAGFMCIGAFTSATFSKLTNGVIQQKNNRQTGAHQHTAENAANHSVTCINRCISGHDQIHH